MNRIYEQTLKAIRTGNVAVAGERPRRQLIPPKSAIGSHLKAVIEEKTGKRVPCGECRAEILRLNRMTPDEVRDEKPKIAKGVYDRGKTKMSWTSPKRWAAELAPSMAMARIEEWIEEAIRRDVASHA